MPSSPPAILPPPPRNNAAGTLKLFFAKIGASIAQHPALWGTALEIAGKVITASDREDIGVFAYKREDRPWHPDTAPGLHAGRVGDHPSSIHHWQAGMILDGFGQMLQAGAKAQQQGAKK